jgi:hypothetical protein
MIPPIVGKWGLKYPTVSDLFFLENLYTHADGLGHYVFQTHIRHRKSEGIPPKEGATCMT